MTETAEPTRARPVSASALVGGLLAADAVLTGVLLRVPQHRWTPIVLTVAALVLYAGLLVVLARARVATTAAVARATVLGGAALQLLAITGRLSTSDDVYRYIWDGLVQFHGVDPYRYAPAAAQLRSLRIDLLFGPHSACTWTIPDGCTAINRPLVHTVYPPVGQGIFDLVRLLSFGGHGGVLPFQVAAALGTTLVSVLIAREAVRLSWPAWRLAAWAWCPLVVIEYGNNAHVDWAASLCSVCGLLSARRGRPVHTGLWVGAAVATKLYPALLLPALLRRHPGRVLGAAAAVGVLGYLPHVAAVGSQVIGYLPGYLHEEGYASGSRLRLLGAVLPHPVDTAVGALALVAAAAWSWRRSRVAPPEVVAADLFGVALLVATPSYGWYGGLLVALVAMSGRWQWLPVAVAPMLAYVTRPTSLPAGAIFLTAALATAALLLTVRRADGRVGVDTPEGDHVRS
ncbi:MAG: glycosyltransferase 87 family protein [Jatrophihabitans sp.]|uniref:glycosyltransferase 87 family protein n=1 Tax=Jatrophihabitans sp. TaxID=1932789 RepID=UPI003F803E57